MKTFEVEITVSEAVVYEVRIEAESAEAAFDIAKARYDKFPRSVVQHGFELERDIEAVIDYFVAE